MKTIALVLLLLALTFSAFPAELGPEQALTPADVVPAAHAQSDPDIAASSRGVLAVWLDRRSGGSHPELYATPLELDGTPMLRYGRKVADAAHAVKVTSSGLGFAVVYGRPTTPGGEVVSVLSSNGWAFTEPVTIGSGTVIDLATAFASTCAILADYGQSQFTAVILDSEGRAVRSIPLPYHADAITPIGGGTDYLVSGVQRVCDGVNACTSNVIATRLFVTPSSVTMKTKVVASSLPFWTRTATVGDSRYAAIAWISEDEGGRFVEWAAVDVELNVNTGPHRIHMQKELTYVGHDFRPSIAGGGRTPMIGYPVPIDAAQTRHHLMAAGVTYLEPVPFRPPVDLGETPSFALAWWYELIGMPPASETYVVTEERGDILVRAYGGSLAQAKAKPVALASSLQSEAQIAVSGPTAMSVWTEGDSSTRIAAALHTPGTFPPTKQIAIAQQGDANRFAPSIASAGNQFFTVWCERIGETTRVLGQRFTSDGAPLDAQSFVLAEPSDATKETAVASDGSDYFVVWSGTSGVVHGRRVRGDGTLEPAMQLSFDANFQTRMSLRVVWTGEMFLTAWLYDGYNPIILAPPPPPRVVVRIARVTRTGILLDSSSNPTVVERWGSSSSIALASNGNRVLLTWIGRDEEACAYATLLTRDGFVSSSASIACGLTDLPERVDIAATWDGQSFLAAWSASNLRGIRVNENGTAFDATELSEAGARAWAPALARIGDGVIAAYTRNTSESFGGVGRVFVRTIGTAEPPPNRRTRSVRR